MTAFILRRSLQSIIVLLVMSLIVFVGVNLVGDPVDMLINPEADQFEIDRVIRELGLDRPVAEQYWYFMINAFQGDLGRSFVFGEPALKLIIQRMPATMELALFSLFIAISFGIPLGVYAGLKPTSKISRTIMASSILGFSMPTFWVGIILIMFFSVNLGCCRQPAAAMLPPISALPVRSSRLMGCRIYSYQLSILPCSNYRRSSGWHALVRAK